MSIFSSYKKIFLLGFIIMILIAIPFSVYIAQKRQNITSKATASTTLSFEPTLTTAKVGDMVTLNIWLDPGTGTDANMVSFIKLSINFDQAAFTTVSDSLTNALNANDPIDGPTYESGKASISLSIGADPTRAIKTKTKIAIFQLKAIAATAPTSPNVTFDTSGTQILSITSSDLTSENVLSTTIPARVTVNAATTGGGATPTSAPTPSATPVPTGTLTAPPPQTGGGFPPLSLAPVCSNLEISGLASGVAPYPLTFVVTGSDPDGTISKISLNFGDSIEDFTEGSGIGTNSISGQIFHTYNTPGIYTAYAILTDNDNNLSAQQASCTKTITVSSTDMDGSLQPSPTIIEPLPPTGPGDNILKAGILGVVFAIIGGVLLILL